MPKGAGIFRTLAELRADHEALRATVTKIEAQLEQMRRDMNVLADMIAEREDDGQTEPGT